MFWFFYPSVYFPLLNVSNPAGKKLCCSPVYRSGYPVRSEISDNKGIERLRRQRRSPDITDKDAFFRIPEVFTECDIQGLGKCLKPSVELVNVKLGIGQQKNNLPALYFLYGILHSFFMPLAMCYDN